MSTDSTTDRDGNAMRLAVAGYEYEWPVDFEALVARELVGRDGALVVRLAEIDEAPALLGRGEVTALIVNADRLGLKEMLLLRECRRVAPQTAVVVVAITASRGMKDALEGGATAFVSWPTSAAVFRQALLSGHETEGTSDPDGGTRLKDSSAQDLVVPPLGSVRPKRGGVHGRR